nr:hypothetical protein [uncultured Halomonas sp.]
MFDREMAQTALNRMTPTMRGIAEAEGLRRGIPACDVVLERGLSVMREEVGQALYSLKKGQVRPWLRVVS